MSKQNEQEKQEAIARLRELLPPGSTVHTIVRHVSRSGMQRTISAIIAQRAPHGAYWEPVDISWLVARADVAPFDGDRGGVKVNGCGMDMGAALVHELGRTLYPDGFGEKCQHCGERPETGAGAVAMRCTPCRANVGGRHEFRGRNGDTSGWDNDGGYALTHRSL